jgi:hypothetical protein
LRWRCRWLGHEEDLEKACRRHHRRACCRCRRRACRHHQPKGLPAPPQKGPPSPPPTNPSSSTASSFLFCRWGAGVAAGLIRWGASMAWWVNNTQLFGLFYFQHTVFSGIQAHRRLCIEGKKNIFDINRAGTTRFRNRSVWEPLQLKSNGSNPKSVPNRV